MIVAYLAMIMTIISHLVTTLAMRQRFKALAVAMMITGHVPRKTLAKFGIVGFVLFHGWFVCWWLMFDTVF